MPILTASQALAVAVANATALGYGDTPLSCEDNSPFIEPSSGFDLRHPSSLFNRSSASWAWIVTGIVAALATLLSLVSILKHLRNFTKPAQQMHIVRILLFVPIYAIVSWLAFRYYWRAVYIFTARDVYESFVIYSFYALILQYLGPTATVQKMALINKPKMHYPIPLIKISYNPASPTFLIRNKILILQYVVVRPLMTVMALVTQLMSRFCSESMSVKYGHFYYTVINFVSVSACMFGLLVMYFTIKDDIAEHKPLPKFFSIKVVIFLTMVQNVVLSTLAHLGKLPSTQYWTETNIANGIQSFLVCIEMLIASIFHVYAFSAKEYTAQDGSHTSILKAAVISFNVLDIFRELGHAFTHLMQWITGNKTSAPVGKSSTGKVVEEVIEG